MSNIEKFINCLHDIIMIENNRLQEIRNNMNKKMNIIQDSTSLLEINSMNHLNNIKLLTILLAVNTTFKIIDNGKFNNIEIGKPTTYYITLCFEGITISIDLLNCMINISDVPSNTFNYDFLYDIKHNQILETNI
jgi:hypothetical protein